MNHPLLYLALLIALLAPAIPRAVDAARRAPTDLAEPR